MVTGQGEGRMATPMRRLAVAVACAAAVVSLAGCTDPTPVAAPSTVSSPAALGATVPPATPSSTPSAVAAATTPVRLRVPAIGVDTTLVRLGLTAKGELAVPTKAMDAGWYTGSPVPGQVGPAVIAGHVHWSGINAVFARLTELAPGDRILVSLADRTTAAFTVDRVATYDKSRFPTALVYGALDFPGLRLITCGGYDKVSRTYEANVIVFATLVPA